jgi:deazaflavin-dependent oxidoreductase (nitroreductase family)
VSVGTIIILSIAALGILMMRFRKRWLAKINVAFTNRITSLFAGSLPGFGILTHVRRRSGKVYRTPINVFRASNGFIIALTYSSQSEWAKNVLAAGEYRKPAKLAVTPQFANLLSSSPPETQLFNIAQFLTNTWEYHRPP